MSLERVSCKTGLRLMIFKVLGTKVLANDPVALLNCLRKFCVSQRNIIHIMKKLIIAAGLLAASSTILTGNSAKAANCVADVFSLADLQTAGSCTYKGATLTFVSMSGFSPTSFLTISAPGPNPATNFSIGVQGDPTPYTAAFTGSFVYTLTAPTGKHLVDYTSALSSATNGGNNTATYNVAGAAGTAAATYNPYNVSIGQTKTYAGTGPASDTFTSTLNVTLGSIQQTSSSYNFAVDPAPASTVPGPLPILGAGAAFGFSRRLRNRIKQFS